MTTAITDLTRRVSSHHLLPWLHWQHPDVAELWEGVDIMQRLETGLLGWLFWREGEGGAFEYSIEQSGYRTTGEAFNAAMSAYAAGEVVPAVVKVEKPKEADGGVEFTPELQEVLHEFVRAQALQKTNWDEAVAHMPYSFRKREASWLAQHAHARYNRALAEFRRLCPTPEVRAAALEMMKVGEGAA